MAGCWTAEAELVVVVFLQNFVVAVSCAPVGLVVVPVVLPDVYLAFPFQFAQDLRFPRLHFLQCC